MCIFSLSIPAGQGVSEDGFQFAGGNILQLQFTIPKQRDAESTISKAELWLFPNMQSVPPGKLLKITLVGIHFAKWEVDPHLHLGNDARICCLHLCIVGWHLSLSTRAVVYSLQRSRAQ